MKQLTRVVTWMGIPQWGTPQQMLEGGSGTFTLPDEQRLYAVRIVSYDNDLTPKYATPIPIEKTYTKIEDLRKDHKDTSYCNAPILDVDNKLKTYRP